MPWCLNVEAAIEGPEPCFMKAVRVRDLHLFKACWLSGNPALQALQEGYQLGQGEGQQVPLSAIVNHSSEGLQTVKNFLDSGKTRLSSPCTVRR